MHQRELTLVGDGRLEAVGELLDRRQLARARSLPLLTPAPQLPGGVRVVRGQVVEPGRAQVDVVHARERRGRGSFPAAPARPGRARSAASMSSTTIPSTNSISSSGTSVTDGSSVKPNTAGVGTLVGSSARRIRCSRATSWAEASSGPTGGRRRIHRCAGEHRSRGRSGSTCRCRRARSAAARCAPRSRPRIHSSTAAGSSPTTSVVAACAHAARSPTASGFAARRICPPSITSVSPVIQRARSEARNATASPTSAGSPIRPSGVTAAT